jgi:hypothetical protein
VSGRAPTGLTVVFDYYCRVISKMPRMIDLHLLSKIAADDAEFRSAIIQQIRENSTQFINRFGDTASHGKWSSCYYQMQDFQRRITPFAEASFLEDFDRQLKIISHSTDDGMRNIVAREIMKRLKEELNLEIDMPMAHPSAHSALSHFENLSR